MVAVCIGGGGRGTIGTGRSGTGKSGYMWGTPLGSGGLYGIGEGSWPSYGRRCSCRCEVSTEIEQNERFIILKQT